MTEAIEEQCWLCGWATGKAGPGDGSIYTDDGELGPFCENCFTAFNHGKVDGRARGIELASLLLVQDAVETTEPDAPQAIHRVEAPDGVTWLVFVQPADWLLEMGDRMAAEKKAADEANEVRDG